MTSSITKAKTSMMVAITAAPGRYTLRVTAADAKTPNAGVVEQAVEVR